MLEDTVPEDTVIDPERMACLADLQQQLGYSFQDLALLDCALTHKSYANEQGHQAHYERLEFLGDAVLELITSTYLFTTYPAAREGQLSKLRASLVSAESLAGLARQLGLGMMLRLGRGEEQTGGREKNSLLAAALEAIIGAIYLDGGFNRVQDAFLTCFTGSIEQQVASAEGRDYKGMLQECTLSLFGCMPTYRVVQEEVPAHQKIFHVQLSLNRHYDCIGTGRSKKAAEQNAAQQLLTLLRKDHPCT